MTGLDAYQIDLAHLKEGDNSLRFRLDNGFFEAVEGADVQGGDVTSDIVVKRAGSVFEINIHSAGVVIVACDRCLDPMQQPIESDYQMVARLGEEEEGDDEDVVVVPREDGMLPIAWPLYEAVALGLPLRHVHPEGQCNEEMARRLKELMVSDEPSAEAEQPADDRWAVLRQLKDNEENK